MTASIVLGIIIAISAFVTITLCTRNIHGKATFAALITATLSIEQIIVYIPPGFYMGNAVRHVRYILHIADRNRV